MEFTNYILESADVADVDVMDIEVAQAMAEMAVLEAMMDCYEKQMVLLEYNYESAEEIFTEAETFVPAMEDWMLENYKAGPLYDKGWKNMLYDKNGQPLYGVFDVSNGEWKRIDKVGYNEKDAEKKAAELNKKNLNPVGKKQANAAPTVPKSPKAPVSGYTADMEGPDMGQFGGGMYVSRPTGGKSNSIEKKSGQVVDNRHTAGYTPPYGKNAQHGTSVMPDLGVDVTEPKQPPKSDKPATNQGTNQGGAKQADQWDGSAAVSSASKSFKNSFKKYMFKAGSVIQQLVLGLIDSIFSVNFDKLADKLAEKGADFTMNDKQFQTINRIEDLMEITQIYYAKFDSMLLSRVNWTRAEVNKYKNALVETTTALRQKYVDTGVFDSTTQQVNSPSKQTTPEDLIDICRALGKGEFKKLLRKCQKEAAAYNTDYNENANIPPEIGKAMRTFVNDLIKVYNKTAKDFKVMVNWSLEVGTVQENRNKHGGVDQSPIGFKKSPKAKELQQQRRAARKAQRNPAAAVEMYENLGGKEYANYDIGGEKTPAWAEEGWSMNLDDESYMYD